MKTLTSHSIITGRESTKFPQLDEALGPVSGVLPVQDIFRLISDRLRQVFDHCSAELILLDERRESLIIAATAGDSRMVPGDPVGDRLVQRAFGSGSVENSGTVMAIPLKNRTQIFGVVRFTGARISRVTAGEALGERLSPLILSSLSAERTRSNALIDVTTDLPNERAFLLMLENQIAETYRRTSARTLAILALDIRQFSSINKKIGHGGGDRVLNATAQTVKDSLRQMDFLARSRDDEFLVILPTATSEIAREVIERIDAKLAGRAMFNENGFEINVELNAGWASFGPDGETPQQLLTAARIRNAQSRSFAPKKIVFFPTE